MYLRLTTFTKTLPKCNFTYLFSILFRSGAPLITLPTAGVLTDLQLLATASNVCTTDARLGGVGRVPPLTKILATRRSPRRRIHRSTTENFCWDEIRPRDWLNVTHPFHFGGKNKILWPTRWRKRLNRLSLRPFP